ncbi:polysaccharide biosynthesis protein [Bacillus sp. 03113]|uniref:polysaccharide biosynthesis protein n=1 Tax=Bacillus sp. 03113 TaxID=2578211 RepID=UPI001144BEB6|nr:polysaccharide biosynthesis protein [Bacillus sp. 03113]
MSSFYKGTFLLVIMAFFGECIEFIVNMVLARELGEHGLGMYMSILPTIFLIVLLASFELPISISKFIAEKDKKYHLSMLKHVIQLTIMITAILMVVTIFSMPFISIFGQYHRLFRWLVLFMIPIVSFSSIARGFFMGKQQMGKIALANFLRRIIQLILLVFLFQWFQFDIETSVLIAFCTLVGSDIVVFLYLIHMFFIQYQQLKKDPQKSLGGKIIRNNLMAVSIPTTGLRVFNSLTAAFQPFLIKAALIHAGLTQTSATEQFGVLAGISMSLGFFPAFIAHSFMIMLIPTVSKAYAEKNLDQMQKLLQQVIILTFLYGGPAVGALYIFAEPLTLFFFHSTTASSYVELLWPYFLFHYFSIPLQAFLIGLGLMKDAVLQTIWSTILSFTAMYILGSMTTLQMDGIIIGMNLGALLLTTMHYLTICRKLGFSVWMSPINRFN